MIFAINNLGVMTGQYRNASGWHPFIYSGGTFDSPLIPGYANGSITGINDLGVIVGNTLAPGQDALGRPSVGFIATSVPEPGTLVGGFAALLLLSLSRFGQRGNS